MLSVIIPGVIVLVCSSIRVILSTQNHNTSNH